MTPRLSIIYIFVILCAVSTPHGLHYKRVKIKPVIVRTGTREVYKTTLPRPKDGGYYSGFT